MKTKLIIRLIKAGKVYPIKSGSYTNLTCTEDCTDCPMKACKKQKCNELAKGRIELNHTQKDAVNEELKDYPELLL